MDQSETKVHQGKLQSPQHCVWNQGLQFPRAYMTLPLQLFCMQHTFLSWTGSTWTGSRQISHDSGIFNNSGVSMTTQTSYSHSFMQWPLLVPLQGFQPYHRLSGLSSSETAEESTTPSVLHLLSHQSQYHVDGIVELPASDGPLPLQVPLAAAVA